MRDKKEKKNEASKDLIEAAIDLFGENGLNGTTTRKIADASGVNLASIQYYFGSKEGLYLATMNYIVDEILKMTSPTLDGVKDSIEHGLSKEEALLNYEKILSGYCAIFIGSKDIEKWAKLVMHEHMQPTEAFDIFYKRYYQKSQNIMCSLVGIIQDKPAEDDSVILQVHSFFGQILGFLIAREPVLRAMKSTALNEKHHEKIQAIIQNNVRQVLNGGAL